MHKSSPRPRLIQASGALLILAMLPACTGEFRQTQVATQDGSPTIQDRYVQQDGGVLEPSDPVTGGGGSMPGGGEIIPDPIEVTPDPCANLSPQERDPGAAPMRLLSHQEFEQIMGSLFPSIAFPPANIPEDERVRTFPINVKGKTSSTHIDRYREMAESYAIILAEEERQWLGCAEPAAEREACVAAFLERFLPRHYRRPVSAEDTGRALSLYRFGVQDQGTHEGGVLLMMEGLLQAPSFMYGYDTPEGTQPFVPVDDFQLAHRMATLLWRSIPDDALLDAAARGELTDPLRRREHALRMLDDPRADAALTQLLLSIFDIDTLDPQSVGLGDEALALHASMVRESTALISHALTAQHADYRILLNAPYTFLDARLATHYGIPQSDLTEEVEPGLYKVTLPGRAGILTHASVLAHYDDVIHRGKRIRNNILCDDVPGPGANIDTEAIPTRADESDRSKATNRMKTLPCSACHQQMDSLGIIFEPFDSRGVLRTQDEHGNPVESSGTLSSTVDIDGDVADASELARKLAGSLDVQNCMAENLFTYGFARVAHSAQDTCTVYQIERALDTHEGDLRQALLTLIDSPTFTMTRTLN